MMPPLITVGSRCAASSTQAIRLVVVVLPCVPPTATDHFSRISSASISARRTTGIRRARAAATSGLSRFTAVETTTTCAAPRLAASWPIATGIPASRRRSTLADSAMSLPCTEYPRVCSTSAMPDMPMPPMPTKWMVPMESGRALMRALPHRRHWRNGFQPDRPAGHAASARAWLRAATAAARQCGRISQQLA